MSFLSSLFPSKKPTSADAEDALAKLRAAHREAVADIAKAEAILARIIDLSDDEHASADALSASGLRAKIRIEAQIAEVEKAHDEAAKAEASAAFFARREAADELVGVKYLAAEARYVKAAREAADAISEMAAIDETVAAINREIAAAKKADRAGVFPEPVPTSDERYRTEADVVTPASTYVVEMVCVDGPFGPEPAGVTSTRNGKVVLHAGESLRTMTRTAPEQRRYGRRLTSPTSGLSLPATRVGEAPYWPLEGR